MKTVVLLGHKARVGKDSVTAEWIHRYPNIVKRFAFADKLKAVVEDLYNFSNEQMYGDGKEIEDKRYPNIFDTKTVTEYEVDDYGIMPWTDRQVQNPEYRKFLTPRRILQIFGQQQRAIYPDIWAAYVVNQIDQLDEDSVVFIPDFRFPNEYNVLLNWKKLDIDQRRIFAIKLNRTNAPEISGQSDISEIALEKFNKWNEEISAENLTDLFSKFEEASAKLNIMGV